LYHKVYYAFPLIQKNLFALIVNRIVLQNMYSRIPAFFSRLLFKNTRLLFKPKTRSQKAGAR